MRQAQALPAPAAPAAPQSPAPYVIRAGDIPRTGQEVQALRIRLDDLRDELQDAASRRQNISRQLITADPAARPGIEARMGELDARILRIERDISAASQQLTNAPAEAITAARPWEREMPARIAKDLIPIVAILSVFVLGPIALTISRLIWKRTSATMSRPPAFDAKTEQRLEQLQQSVDTIAIEVERISEGQRFVTKLLSERPASLGAGPAEPVRQSKKAEVRSERG